MEKERIQKRLQAVRAALKEKKLDALVVTKTQNVRYLTGFSGHDSWAVVLGRSTVLITDSRYTEQAVGECAACKIVERRKPIADALADQLSGRGLGRIGVENTTSLAAYQAIRKALRRVGLTTTPVGGLVERPREIKEQVEVGLIRRAAEVAWGSLQAALKQLRAGMTEQELTAELEYEMKSRGAVPGFDTIIAFGPNGSRNHHQPQDRRLRSKDTILIDFGACLCGYTCDITRSFAFGSAGREYRRAWQAVYAAQQAAIAKIRDGVSVAEVDAAARNVIEQSGFPVYGHGTGHGLGLEVHESPYLSPLDRKSKLRAGQVITVEPGIYLPGRFGIRIEDDVQVTEAGSRVLTTDSRHGFRNDELCIL